MTAAMKPVQTEAVAATAPCREEKKVPTRPGSAEPVKMPVKFYQHSWSDFHVSATLFVLELT